MFIDKVRTKFIAGKGGNGVVRFDFRKRPTGGDGGTGGNIYLKGSTSAKDLRAFTGGQKFRAKNGEPGGREKATGRRGKDLVLEVPIGTSLLKDGFEIVKVDSEKRFLIAKGGRGGKGNNAFRTGGFENRNKSTLGDKGDDFEATLELKLSSDVVFIGFPNAGKSSLLNALSRANVKVASYEFTTLEPHLGVSKYGLRIMDLPGLIEGTSEGKGLGTRFTKHAEQSEIICHVISLESEDLNDRYKRMRKEIETISPILAEKPEVIIFTKKDLYSDEEIETKLKTFKSKNKNILVTSAYIPEEVAELQIKLSEIVKDNKE